MDKSEIKNMKAEIRQKYAQKGLGGLSQTEITELILSYSEKGDFRQKAQKLSTDYGSFNALADADSQFLMQTEGVSEQTAVLLKAVSRLAVVRSADTGRFRTLKTAQRTKDYFSSRFMGSSAEQLAAVAVNSKMRIISFGIVAGGTGFRIDSSCRSIIEFALKNDAHYLFIAHNHPNSPPYPSESDIIATRAVISSLRLLDIELIDHIITGKGSAFSMRESCQEYGLDFAAAIAYHTAD